MLKIKSKILSTLLILSTVSIIFISCKSDDDNDDITTSKTLTNENLAGNWIVKNYNNTQVVNTTDNSNGQTTTESSETLGHNFSLTYDFSSSSNTVLSSGFYTASTSLENGTTVESDLNEITGIKSNSNWNVSNNIISLTNPDFIQNLTVISFIGNKLELEFIYSYNLDDSLYNHEYTFNSSLVLEKL
ncbi:hypothetical protein [uncultured Lacinutrix sp.]|uniref:hypothetical protein n=1 Tax=uncultured Lacinutrix sp. TaxID=574032 RepID=UPI002631A83B|nr:hypothetical protein [uncultured Lacinutrix sp.]